MNAALTGGSGFLGQSLVRMLLSRFSRVRALVRSPESARDLAGLGAEPVFGDVAVDGHPWSDQGLVQPGDTVFHAAARVEMTGGWDEFSRVTIDGTRRLLDASLPLKPRRFVYVSSASVYMSPRVRPPFSAATTPTCPVRHNYYAVAKLAAEDLVRTACDAAGCPWVILRLGFLYGPGNHTALRHMTGMSRRKWLRIVGSGDNRIAATYVDDAARAVLLAGMADEAAGRIYDVASDEHVTQERFLAGVADAFGLPSPEGRVPVSVAFVAAGLSELWARLRSRTPSTTRWLVRLMASDQALDTRRIHEDIGWRPEVDFAEGLRRTAAWAGRVRENAAGAVLIQRQVSTPVR